MTTDRTAPSRPTALAERSAHGPRTRESKPNAFAALLGAQAPADPKRPEAPKRADAKRDAEPANDAQQATPDQPGAVDGPAVAPEPAPVAPAILAEPLPATAEQLVAQLASPLPAPQPVTGEPAAPSQAAAPAAGQPGAVQVPAAPVETAHEAPAAQPAEADPAAPAAEAPQLPTVPGKTDDAKLPQAPVASAPQPQSAPQSAAQPNAGDAGKQQRQPEQTAAPAPTPSAAPGAEAPKADPTAAPVQAPPAAPAQPVTAPQRAVPLYRAPHVAAAVIQLAQSHGVTHARINLKPAELGGIEVRLRSTPQGIAAHLVADSPEAAKALSQAGGDLRRQLEARDVALLSLDVSTSGDDRREATFGAELGGDGSPGTPSGGRHRAREADEPTEAPAVTTLVLPDGVLVDVLA